MREKDHSKRAQFYTTKLCPLANHDIFMQGEMIWRWLIRVSGVIPDVVVNFTEILCRISDFKRKTPLLRMGETF
jgi:hypothetical protein